jgi:rod shape-determining protein MreD
MQDVISLKKIENTGRFALPYLVLFLFTIFNLIHLPLPYTGLSKPYFILIFIYYFAIYRPTLIPPLFCFILGVIVDTLSGVPIGLNAFIFVGVQWIVSDQRRFLTGQPYITIWAVFVLVCIACGAWQWGLLGLTQLEWSSPIPGMVSIAISLFIFPFATLLLNFIHRILPVASGQLPRVS